MSYTQKNLILTKKKFQRFYRREYKCMRKIMIETNGMKKTTRYINEDDWPQHSLNNTNTYTLQ